MAEQNIQKYTSGYLGCDRLEFYRLLSEHGFSAIHYTAEELEEEARSSREIAARVKRP